MVGSTFIVLYIIFTPITVNFQICLWGNKCDLSLSCGDSMVPDSTLLEMGKKFTEKIISNDLQKAIEILQLVF